MNTPRTLANKLANSGRFFSSCVFIFLQPGKVQIGNNKARLLFLNVNYQGDVVTLNIKGRNNSSIHTLSWVFIIEPFSSEKRNITPNMTSFQETTSPNQDLIVAFIIRIF